MDNHIINCDFCKNPIKLDAPTLAKYDNGMISVTCPVCKAKITLLIATKIIVIESRRKE